MSKCAGIMSCKCLRPSPWKKALKNLYPPQSSGYERDLEAQNTEDLVKLALRNEKLYTPISNALVKNINRDLRKEKYGYVSIGVSAFVALVDMCNEYLFRFESSVYNVLATLLQVQDVNVRLDAMHLFIKLCQCKENNDDASNSKYFDFLDTILDDCKRELETAENTMILRKACVDVLYQLILICPAALITTYLPRIIPVLITLAYSYHQQKGNEAQQLYSQSIQSLSIIYPLVNVITSQALLTPLFESFDLYGWYPISFVQSALKSLINTKNRDGFGKPGYLHVLSHITTLLPALSYDEDSKEDEPHSFHRSTSAIELDDFTITARKLRLVSNILLYIQNIFNETRISAFLHIQQVSDSLTNLFQYVFILALKNDLTFPLTYFPCTDESTEGYPDIFTDSILMRKCVSQLYSICRDTLISFGKSITEVHDYIRFIEDLLCVIDESDSIFESELLRLTTQIVAARSITGSSLVFDLIQDLSSKLVFPDSEIRLLYIHLLSTLTGVITKKSTLSISSHNYTSLSCHLLRSMFMENNTKEHYEGLSTLFTHVLSIDIQNGLLLLLPVLFSSQSIVVQKLVHLDSSNLLIQYLDSSTVSPAILLKHNPTVLSQSTSQYNFISSLDTVAEGEEEEEEPEQISIQPSSDSHMEIDLSALDNHITLTGTFPVIPDEIPLVDEMEEQSPYGVSSPEGTYYQILELNIMALDAIADAISSEELKQYIQNIQNARTQYHWNDSEKMEEECDGKLTFFQKEAIVQFVVRSPFILSSAVPGDYAEKLRLPLDQSEEEEGDATVLHRINSVSNGSEISMKNSVKDSDSEMGDWGGQHDLECTSTAMGSKYLMSNPQCTFEELFEKMKAAREGKDMKCSEHNEQFTTSDVEEVSAFNVPGTGNQTITLML